MLCEIIVRSWLAVGIMWLWTVGARVALNMRGKINGPTLKKGLLQYNIHRKVYTVYEVALWLRHYATNRKVAGSIPDEVILPNPSGRTRPRGLISL
jgi:hypothetical protein